MVVKDPVDLLVEVMEPEENAWSKLRGRREPEPRKRVYKKPKRNTKSLSEREDQGTILKYLSKTLNVGGLCSKDRLIGSKRKYDMVEQKVSENECGAVGAMPKKLKFGQNGAKCGNKVISASIEVEVELS